MQASDNISEGGWKESRKRSFDSGSTEICLSGTAREQDASGDTIKTYIKRNILHPFVQLVHQLIIPVGLVLLLLLLAVGKQQISA